MTHTRHASARLKRASQLLCYSASLGCSHDPHRIPNLGVASSTDWVDEKVDDGDKVQPSGVSLSASPRALSWASELQCDFRLIAENQMLPRREGARQGPRPVTVQLRDSMGYCLLPSTPPPPARRPPQPPRFISSLILRYVPRDSSTAARCRFRDGSAFPAI